MRQYTVSLKDEESKILQFRGSIVVLKEGDVHTSDSPIYQFFSKYFVPSEYYINTKKKEDIIIEQIQSSEEIVEVEEIKKPKKTSKKKNSVDEFNQINNNENDVIIETTNQE
jgi:hypothetical protein